MKILICGGGTAGWLAALMISKIQKNSHDVTVIESSKIGIVGAGEGSTGYLTDIIQNVSWDYGCNEEDFFRETGATVKLGIKHKDWRNIGHTYYGPIDGTSSSGGLPDLMLCYALLHDLPVHTSSQNGYLIDKNSSGYRCTDAGIESDKGNAYHFDAHKVGQYFKKIVLANGVKHIDAEIIDVHINEHGIKSLSLEDGTEVSADFYIDCTGFAKKLMTALNVNWKTYKSNLPVDTAMPFLLKYKPNEVIEPVTTAWAQTSGWMWQIPTAERYGCGYVFDSNFISNDQAQAEIEQVLGQEIDPIRFLKFETGRLEKVWYKNCLALGLCAAFAEPLEATSIHSTIVQLNSFIFDYLKDTVEDTVNIGSQNIYNRRMCDMYDDFKDFLVLHYQTQRADSKFWQWMQTGETRTDFVNNIIELSKIKIPQPADFRSYYGYAGAPLWNWILAGLDIVGKHQAEKDMKFYGADLELSRIRWQLHDNDMQGRLDTMTENTEFIARFR
jgi:tryptophan halogenase